MHHRLQEWQSELECERSLLLQSQFYKKIPTPTLKFPSNLLMRSTYSTALVKHRNIDINTSYITMQTHAGTTKKAFSKSWGGVREQVHNEKLALYGVTCVFSFIIFSISFLLLSLWYYSKCQGSQSSLS